MENETFYTWGYILAGVLTLALGFITLIVDIIPVIWIGGFLVGVGFIYTGLRNFVKLGSLKGSNKAFQNVINLFNQGMYQECLTAISEQRNDQNITNDGKNMLDSLSDGCYIKIDDEKLGGKISNIEELINNNLPQDALDKISELPETSSLTSSSVFYINSLKARCYGKMDDHETALKEIKSILDEPNYIKPVEDYIFKSICEIKLNKIDDANKTISQAKSKYPNNKTLNSFIQGLKKSSS
ncbi:MAG: hypothetical protein ACFFD1_13775 [Candidatus Thorarchaeota archaeon]